ncbi:MAG: LCP family protein [Nonomuraea sp.]|nr:LCP family protein [Nonomuraea sp.]
MDDLKLLRDLGAELEHQPPATLAAQRNRLLSGRARRTRWSWLAMGLVGVATAATITVPVVLVNAGGERVPPSVGTRPVNVTGVQNVLVIGSDTREGANSAYGRPQGRRADTMLIVHIPADRGKATVVSLPRDSLVKIPKCGANPASVNMLNSAYSAGGVTCARATVEHLTGMRVDHYVELDFAGFKKMVDALGGVEVTLPRPVDDKAAKLKLPAGRSMLNGEQALGYVRLRRYGDGSDVQRIKRQQALMLSMLKRVKTRPEALRGFLSATREAIRTDFDLESMYKLATQLQGSKVGFATVPWKPAPTDPNRIVWKQPEAQRLFDQLK